MTHERRMELFKWEISKVLKSVGIDVELTGDLKKCQPLVDFIDISLTKTDKLFEKFVKSSYGQSLINDIKKYYSQESINGKL